MATLTELKQQAKSLGFKGYSRLKKDELEKLIAGHKQSKKKPSRSKHRIKIPKTVEEASVVLSKLSKGEARKLRKQLREAGQIALASASRIAS